MADKKYKIVKDYVPPADAEISDMMDFEAVSQQLTTATVSNALVLKVLLGLGAAGVAFCLLLFGLSPEKANQRDVEIVSQHLGLEAPMPATVQGLPKMDEVVQWLAQKPTGRRTAPAKSDTARQIARNTSPAMTSPAKTAENATQQQKDLPSVVPNKFTDAAPVVGFDSLYRYLKESLVYPLEAPGDTIEGVVEIMFMVNRDGAISDPQVMTSLGEPFDKEALRVIRNMPPWNPAKVNETTMSIRKQIAIQFRKLDTRR